MAEEATVANTPTPNLPADPGQPKNSRKFWYALGGLVVLLGLVVALDKTPNTGKVTLNIPLTPIPTKAVASPSATLTTVTATPSAKTVLPTQTVHAK